MDITALFHLQTDKLCIDLIEEQFPSLGTRGDVWKEATVLVVSGKLDLSNLIDVRSCSLKFEMVGGSAITLLEWMLNWVGRRMDFYACGRNSNRGGGGQKGQLRLAELAVTVHPPGPRLGSAWTNQRNGNNQSRQQGKPGALCYWDGDVVANHRGWAPGFIP